MFVTRKLQFFILPKLKALGNDKINGTQNARKERKRCGKGKGENVGYQHFLLFPLCFQTLSS